MTRNLKPKRLIMRFPENSCRGMATVTLTLVVCLLSSLFLFNAVDRMTKNRTLHVREIDSLLLNETTLSTFAVMEAALNRRMWEPPPDASCLKSTAFDVTGSFSNGVSWKVEATYNPKTKNFEMWASGSKGTLKAKYLKYMKVMDASDFLLYSASNKSVYFSRLFNPDIPTSLIAGDRRIYVGSQGRFVSMLDMGNPKVNFNGSGAPFPGTYGTILQADRMQFLGGLLYGPHSVPEPNVPPESPGFKTLLAPYSNVFGMPPVTLGQLGGGVAVLTKDLLKGLFLEFVGMGV